MKWTAVALAWMAPFLISNPMSALHSFSGTYVLDAAASGTALNGKL